MKKLWLLGAVAIGACASIQERPETQIGSVNFIDASGVAAGTALLYQVPNGIRVVANLPGLSAGEHGFHFHAIGSCLRPSFDSAGPHFNPASRQHGRSNPAGPHAGDLPNVDRNPMEFIAEGVQASSLLDADGAALVVHANADDYRTDPSGNSGARIRCGVITPR